MRFLPDAPVEPESVPLSAVMQEATAEAASAVEAAAGGGDGEVMQLLSGLTLVQPLISR